MESVNHPLAPELGLKGHDSRPRPCFWNHQSCPWAAFLTQALVNPCLAGLWAESQREVVAQMPFSVLDLQQPAPWMDPEPRKHTGSPRTAQPFSIPPSSKYKLGPWCFEPHQGAQILPSPCQGQFSLIPNHVSTAGISHPEEHQPGPCSSILPIHRGQSLLLPVQLWEERDAEEAQHPAGKRQGREAAACKVWACACRNIMTGRSVQRAALC